MADQSSDLPTDLASGNLQLPEASREKLREFIETKDPVAFENFLNGVMLQVSVMEQKSHSGPLPSPDDLRDYEGVLPGLAERIVRLAERPAEEYGAERIHRHQIEASLSSHSRHYRYLGLAMGFAIAFVCVGAAVWFAIQGNVTAAVIFLGVPLAGLVGNFIRGAVTTKESEPEKNS